MNVSAHASVSSLETLYCDHYGWLQRWLHRRLGNVSDAADLAHDTFIRLLTKPSVRGFGSFAEARAYLRATASGLCVDLWRHREVEAAWLQTLAAQPEPMAPSPEHQAAWTHIESVSRKFEPLRSHGSQGTAAAVAGVEAARATAVTRRRALSVITGGLGLGALAWLSWRHTPLPEWVMALRADYYTGTGERRGLILADGSRVWLNTRTALRVDYQPSQRRLILLSGEILIQTVSDSQQRLFYVDTGHGRMQALGTRFNVRQTDARTRLDVFDGAVEIRARTGKTWRVNAGRAAVFDAGGVTALERADPMREAWSRGSLSADNMRLGDLLAELSRYRHGYINVAPEVADLSVMGVYPADDPERALNMLARTLPIRVRRTLPWRITVDAR